MATNLNLSVKGTSLLEKPKGQEKLRIIEIEVMSFRC